MTKKDSAVRVEVAWPREQKRRLRDALASVLGTRAWAVLVRPTLVYSKPLVGSWWWKVSVTETDGNTQTLLVEPGHQTAEFVVDLVRRAVARELLNVMCASCGKVAVRGVWQRRDEVPAGSRVSHGLCPDCAQSFYPEAMRRIRTGKASKC